MAAAVRAAGRRGGRPAPATGRHAGTGARLRAGGDRRGAGGRDPYALVQPTRTGDRVAVRFEPTAGADTAAGRTRTPARTVPARMVPLRTVPPAGSRRRRAVRLGRGCRLIGFSVDTVGAAQPAVTVRELRQTGPAAVLLDRAAFADRSRWRPTVGTDELGPTLVAAPVSGVRDAGGTGETGGLTIRRTSTPVQTIRVTGDVFVVDAPVPLPVLTAGELPTPELAGDTRLRLASQDVPARPVATARLLPLLGRSGSLVDLEYLDRLLPNADHDAMQVWLTADAGDALVGRLREGGLTVLSDETPDKVSARYGNQGPALGLRFQLLVALLGALLAAGAVTVVAAVESPARAAELAALRGQGVRPRTVRAVALTGHLALVGVALVAGVVAAVVADAATRTAGTMFADGFNLLPVPDPGPLGLGLALAVPIVLIGGAAAIAGAALTRAVRANGVRLR